VLLIFTQPQQANLFDSFVSSRAASSVSESGPLDSAAQLIVNRCCSG
jgi:hypothetical protein